MLIALFCMNDIKLDITKRFLKSYRILYADEKVNNKKDFCLKIGLICQNLSKIERYEMSCTIEYIYNLSTNFGVSLNWIFFGEGDFYANN